jgi:hypothetical protein
MGANARVAAMATTAIANIVEFIVEQVIFRFIIRISCDFSARVSFLRNKCGTFYAKNVVIDNSERVSVTNVSSKYYVADTV